MADLPEQTFALIVGGGPVGLTTALALARYGYDSVIIERHAQRMGQPKAHVLHARSLEVYRQLGVDSAPLRKAGIPPCEAQYVRFVDTMEGLEFGRIRRAEDEACLLSPEPTFNVPQPELEEHLLSLALKTNKITYIRMLQWESCEEGEQHIIMSKVLCRSTNMMKTIRSKYLVGCDGARARSRDILGIQFDPLHGETQQTLNYVSVHFQADLSHMKNALLFFIVKTKRMGAFIAYNRRNSWVYFTQYDPVLEPKSLLTPKYLKQIVVDGIGAEVPDYKELGITLWTTSPQLARTYRSTKITNAFLAGDAAHSFPPTGGLGVNTGIADVQNLAWKIHAVEQGWASPVFLDTVSRERLPVARENCRQSKLNEDKIWQLAQSILQPACVPEQLLRDPGKAQEIQNLIDENREHFHTFNLQLGYAYGYPLTRTTADYQKEIVPGVRLPHYWLEKQRSRISTLDLISGFSFVLISMTHMTNSTSITVNSVPVDIFQQGRDFDDLTGAFSDLMAKHVVRAVLVRPDHHIVGPVKSIEDIEHLLSAYFSAF